MRQAVAEGFGDVIAGDGVGGVEVGDAAGDAQNAVIAARRETEAVGGIGEQGAGRCVESGGLVEKVARKLVVR